MLKYFRNPEIKELTFKFSIIFILFAILTTIFIKSELNKLNKDYINQKHLNSRKYFIKASRIRR
ncbi:sensor histidine kinase [Clostridium botulinum F str. 230613]|nr:sensor histidine kinase [Clostridium botulinum F str. 230613]